MLPGFDLVVIWAYAFHRISFNLQPGRLRIELLGAKGCPFFPAKYFGNIMSKVLPISPCHDIVLTVENETENKDMTIKFGMELANGYMVPLTNTDMATALEIPRVPSGMGNNIFDLAVQVEGGPWVRFDTLPKAFQGFIREVLKDLLP